MSRRRKAAPRVAAAAEQVARAPLPTRRGMAALPLAAIALAYVLFATAHLATTPVLSEGSFINAPDEPAHLACVRLIATERRLPTRADSATTYQWHQPPLYYLLAAPLWHLGPLAVRGLGIAFGLAGVLLVWAGARRLAPGDLGAATLAAGLAALLPMRHAVTSAAGNDALTEALTTLTLVLALGVMAAGPSPARAAGLGASLGAALLAKASALTLVPIVLAAMLWTRRTGHTWRSVVLGCAVMAAASVAVSGWWFARNLALYGAPLPTAAFAEAFAGTQQARDWVDRPVRADLLTGELAPADSPLGRSGYTLLIANWTWRTLIGAYTPPAGAPMGVPRFLPPGFYLPHLLLAAWAAAGLALLLVRARGRPPAHGWARAVLLAAAALLVLAAFAAFTWTYFQAQGRYLFPAMLPIAGLAAVGIRATVPEARRGMVSATILSVLALLSALFLFGAVIPAYEASP
ncbi:MAG TPA: glycosyltransferase family 39 protein [Chthonomonadales bacterium]|nr:glycosyltransferase family 39 protein [Chthonomonadales bacterium]